MRRLYELQARAFEAAGRPIAQHRAQAEAYFRRGNLAAAVDQLEIAVKQTRGSDFYELSIAESRLRELRPPRERTRRREGAQDHLMGRALAVLALLACGIPLPALAQTPAAELFVRADKGHCIACHQLPPGSGPQTRADLGPRLEGTRMRELGKPALRDVIVDPTRANPDTVMPPYGRHRLLEPAEIDRLVEYLHALP